MAKLTRVFQKQFAQNAGPSDIGKFGSLAAGSAAYTTDPATIQSLSEFLDGWAAETIATNRPALEDFNALDYLIFYQIRYLFENGIPEWETNTTYYTGSFVQVSGVIYQSKTDNNAGNDPTTDTTNWKPYAPSGTAGAVNLIAKNNAVTPNTKIDVTADAIQMANSDGDIKKFTSFSKTLDASTTGANGLDSGVLGNNQLWYLFAIGKPDGTSALFASQSSTPTLPTGYTYKMLLSQARTDGSAHFLKFHQYGREGFYDSTPAIYNATPGASFSAWAAVDTSSYIGAALSKIGKFLLAAPSSQEAGFTTDNSVAVAIATNAPNKTTQTTNASLAPQTYVEGPIINSSNNVYVAGSAGVILYCVGWTVTSW